MKFRGSQCKTDCSGHRAGLNYYLKGGRKKSRTSSSFNRGMKIGIKAAKAKAKRRRK
jgi:hypothetical protein